MESPESSGSDTASHATPFNAQRKLEAVCAGSRPAAAAHAIHQQLQGGVLLLLGS